MNLSKIFFWKKDLSTSENASSLPPENEMEAHSSSNVIPLPSLVSDIPNSLDVQLSDNYSAIPVLPRTRSLLDTPELKSFFTDNYFGLGRHNGANYKTHDSLVLGKQAIISKFQNAISTLIEQKQAKTNRLRNVKLQTEGICETTSSQLILACDNLEREMSTLREQIEMSANDKGWVLNALNSYQIGFNKGLREVIDFELLPD